MRLRLASAFAALAVALVGGCSPDAPEDSSTSGTPGAGTGGGASNGGAGGATVSSTGTTMSVGPGGGGEGGGAICAPDADGDQIPDAVEGMTKDTDGDGTPDYLDTDSDGDSIPDLIEGQTQFVGCNTPLNSDAVDEPDYLDTDSDNNGLPDLLEVYPDQTPYDPAKADPNPADTDGDGVPDYADPDNDGDSLPDTLELDNGQAVDTDGDGLPDLDDIDSDDDSIGDAYEGLADPDGDGVPAFRDDDSDGDGLSDACEAGKNHQVGDPPADTDNDGKYDFLDLDSDGDGLPDAVEDSNKNCVLDDGETDPFQADTDGDGVDDLIETVLGSDPRNAFETPATLGKYYFVLPYLGAPAPATNIVPLKTNLNQGDVAFLVDTTATMGGEIQNLKLGMSGIIQSLYAAIPDLAVGVAGFDDFPTGTYGFPPNDKPFYVAGPTGYVSKVLADNLAAVQTLNVHDGGDFPESQIAAMYRALTDTFLIWDSGSIAPTGAPNGTYGSLHFRDGSLPILVGITDAAFHNGKRANAGVLHDPYSFNDTPPFPTPKIDDLVTALKARGGFFIGLSAANGVRSGGDPYEDMAYLVDHVGSYVPPSAFGGALCATGLLGSTVAIDGPPTAESPAGTCRLVFDINTNGTGIGSSVVSGVQALLKSIHLDVRALASPDPGDPLDSVDSFIETIQVNASGGNDDAEPGVPCIALNPVAQLTDIWTGPKGLLKLQDGINETALGIVPTQKVCFKIVPKQNAIVMQQTNAQVFKASLIVKAKNGAAQTELVLGTPREIAFIIPPNPQ